jgi:hypothetical protein
VRRGILTLLIAAGLVAAACGPSTARRDQDRAEIERLLADYARRLSEAYRSGSAETLREVATEREISRVHKQISEQAGNGRMLVADLVTATVQSVEFHRSSATATVAETWNLKVLAVGSGAVLSESPAQENQILYSLTRAGGRWWILSRILARSSED